MLMKPTVQAEDWIEILGVKKQQTTKPNAKPKPKPKQPSKGLQQVITEIGS